MALIKSKQIDSINLAQLANLNSGSDTTPSDLDILLFGDQSDSFNPKKVQMQTFAISFDLQVKSSTPK